jgi:hypothetical protein
LTGAALSMSFLDLPSMVLFAKVTPKNIEGTVFAFLLIIKILSRNSF